MRQQLGVFKRNVKRPRLSVWDRLFWSGLMTIWKDWRSALVIVRPETVIGWQRRRFKRYWWRLSQRKRPGRPPVGSEIRHLVPNMVAANPTWGAPRIHGELLKLGFEISERTVSRLMPKRDKRPSQTWKNVSAQSCRPTRFGGFLHRRDDSITRAVCFCIAGARPSSCSPFQCHRIPNRVLGCTTNR